MFPVSGISEYLGESVGWKEISKKEKKQKQKQQKFKAPKFPPFLSEKVNEKHSIWQKLGAFPSPDPNLKEKKKKIFGDGSVAEGNATFSPLANHA